MLTLLEVLGINSNPELGDLLLSLCLIRYGHSLGIIYTDLLSVPEVNQGLSNFMTANWNPLSQLFCLTVSLLWESVGFMFSDIK